MEYLIQKKKIKLVGFRRLFFVFFGIFFNFCSFREGFGIYLNWNQALVFNRVFLYSPSLLNNIRFFYQEFFLFASQTSCFILNERLSTKFVELKFFNTHARKSVYINQTMKHVMTHSFTKTNHFIDMTAVDMLGRKPVHEKFRFYLLYIFFCFSSKLRVFFSIFCSKQSRIPSLQDVFPCTGWSERECFDMFGLKFISHSDLRRILTDYGFRGFPLRKDFPVTGFLQTKFDENTNSVVYEKINLMQIEREIEFVNPWSFSLSHPSHVEGLASKVLDYSVIQKYLLLF